eukprot:807882-Amorphochlora_amoeboformis.AAC.1
MSGTYCYLLSGRRKTWFRRCSRPEQSVKVNNTSATSTAYSWRHLNNISYRCDFYVIGLEVLVAEARVRERKLVGRIQALKVPYLNCLYLPVQNCRLG